MGGKLYVVGTPIGNLGDFSSRAIETLSICDFIAAEDTRVTLKLLNHFGIKKPLLSYHEHNRFDSGERIAARIEAGEVCAIVTDAGMPAISDPGEDLVRLCRERGIEVESVPGPCAFATALAVSGMPSGRFTFEGFLSMNKISRREHLEQIKDEKRTMIFYEAPHKLVSTLKDMLDALGDRNVAIARELTKIHEQVVCTTLSQAVLKYTEEPPRGEIVIVLEGAKEPEKPQTSLEDAAAEAIALAENGMQKSEASKLIAKKYGYKKSDVYKFLNVD